MAPKGGQCDVRVRTEQCRPATVPAHANAVGARDGAGPLASVWLRHQYRPVLHQGGCPRAEGMLILAREQQ